MDLSIFPTMNATLNATSGCLVVAGVLCIRAKRLVAHAAIMKTACGVTALFFASYLFYHAQVGSIHFRGTGWVRPLYFVILTTHTLLAVAIVPLVIRTVWLATRKRFDAHKAMARWTVPLWLYVSVTGVIIYLMLYRGLWTR